MSYENTLQQLALKDERFIIMTAENRAAIRNLPAILGNRFIDVGIAEQTMIGAAAGLALRGRIPVTHALSTFLTLRAFEFIRTDVGISGLPVKLVGAVAGFLSEANGPTHQAIEDVSLMRGIPNVGVFCPADEEDMLIGLPAILQSELPFYIRHNATQTSIKHSREFEIGKAEVLSEGDDVAILVYGVLTAEALKAVELMQAKGRSVRLLNMRTLKPIDEFAVIEAAKQTKLMVTIEDHFLTGGLFSIVSELLVKKNVYAQLLPIALEERWFKPALLQDVLEYEGFTGDQLAVKIEAKLENI